MLRPYPPAVPLLCAAAAAVLACAHQQNSAACVCLQFGLSAFFIPGKRLRVHCGSPSYAAPEIVARKQYEGPLVVRHP